MQSVIGDIKNRPRTVFITIFYDIPSQKSGVTSLFFFEKLNITTLSFNMMTNDILC